MKHLLTLVFAMMLVAPSFAQDASKDVKASFLAMLDGSEEAAQKAVDTYGSDDVKENGMIPFGSNPKVTKTEDNCLFFTLEDDGDANEYYICSKGGKIVQFDWADMLDDEE